MTTAMPTIDPQSTAIPPIIELRGVTKLFPATRRSGEVLAVKNLDLTVADKAATCKDGYGEFLVLLGPSGCGKSTILSMISGLALPEEGEVLVYGRPVSGPHKSSASVPQAYTCFPWLSALKNVEFGLSLQAEITEEQRRTIAKDYLAKVGLGAFEHAYHRQLSGGMQQRVAIARTLALKRPIVLMDEPFGALDAQTRAEMQQMLLELWKDEKSTIVFVTHDITEALLLADRIIVFSPRPASIVADLEVPFGFERPPEIVHKQKFVECAEYLRMLLGHKPEEKVPTAVPMATAKSLSVTRPPQAAPQPVQQTPAVAVQAPARPVAAAPIAAVQPVAPQPPPVQIPAPQPPPEKPIFVQPLQPAPPAPAAEAPGRTPGAVWSENKRLADPPSVEGANKNSAWKSFKGLLVREEPGAKGQK